MLAVTPRGLSPQSRDGFGPGRFRPAVAAQYERMFASNRRPKGPYKRAEYEEARRLRRERGMPMKQIAAHLGVSPGTVHLWTNDIEISAEQAAATTVRPRERGLAGMRPRSIEETGRPRRQQAGRERARETPSIRPAACSTGPRGPRAQRSRLRQLRSADGPLLHPVPHASPSGSTAPELSCILNVYLGNGMAIEEIEDHWLEKLGLPRSSLRKHILNHYPTSSSGGKRAKLPYGVCTVKVHSHRARPAHLRRDPGVRGLRGAAVARRAAAEAEGLEGRGRLGGRPAA